MYNSWQNLNVFYVGIIYLLVLYIIFKLANHFLYMIAYSVIQLIMNDDEKEL